jgi:GT2 family glycosyltransferase
MQKVTFIIPHRGRLDYLRETVISIANQQYEKSLFNVIVLTQDDKNCVVDALANIDCDCTVMKRNRSETISSMRNFGATQTVANWLAFIDADIKLSPDWICAMLDAIKSDDSHVLVSAKQVAPEKVTFVEKIRIAVGNTLGGVSVGSLPGHNLFLSRKQFENVGGFPTKLATCEDYCFTLSLAEIGKLFIAENGWYIHLGEDKSFSQLFKKEYWRAGSNLKSLNGRKVPVREYPSLLLPLYFFSLLVLVLFSLVRLQIMNSLSFGLMYFIPIAAYSIRIVRRNTGIHPLLIFVYYFLYHTARSFGTIAGVKYLFQRENWR